MLTDAFCAEHRELEVQAAELLRVVAAQSPDSASVAGLRWGMARALAKHCEGEARFVEDRLPGSRGAIAAVDALRRRQDDGALVAQFHAYLLDWPVGRIAGQWAEFGNATRAMLALIAERLAREEAHLYAHADRAMARRAA